MRKIKWKWAFFALGIVVVLAILTRFFNLSWGLPYPFHPDERNMAVALTQLSCANPLEIQDCLNPHFFAYGQLPLYISLTGIGFYKLITRTLGQGILLSEAIITLRLLSAFSSVLAVFIFARIVQIIWGEKKQLVFITTALLLVFSPALIQFAHFGTTESLLTLFYGTLILTSLRFIKGDLSKRRFLYTSALLVAAAAATKISSLVFFLVPVSALLFFYKKHRKTLIAEGGTVIYLGCVIGIATILLSPQNLLSLPEFIGSLNYEASVAQGLPVFYTRSFFMTIPVIFQFLDVLPYALGVPILALFILGFVTLPKSLDINFLRVNLLLYFFPTAFLYAKWTRFMAPVLPLMIVIAALFILTLLQKSTLTKILAGILLLLALIPGTAYLSVYAKPDVRETASQWIVDYIPQRSSILSETANVVDIPLALTASGKEYRVESFNFYELDENPLKSEELKASLKSADYIFVPSRRIFANHTCVGPDETKEQDDQRCRELQKKYPRLNEYYAKLFSGELGFEKVAEFNSYPSVEMLGKKLVVFPDEEAEETWSVFDHPVIRIYRRVN